MATTYCTELWDSDLHSIYGPEIQGWFEEVELLNLLSLPPKPRRRILLTGEKKAS